MVLVFMLGFMTGLDIAALLLTEYVCWEDA